MKTKKAKTKLIIGNKTTFGESEYTIMSSEEAEKKIREQIGGNS